jgi:hypothetical protein
MIQVAMAGKLPIHPDALRYLLETKKPEALRKCPYCREKIPAEAGACKHCGHELTPDYEMAESLKTIHKKKRWLAILLNFFPFIFGLGYAYSKSFGRFLLVFLLEIFFLGMTTWLGAHNFFLALLGVVWVLSILDVWLFVHLDSN